VPRSCPDSCRVIWSGNKNHGLLVCKPNGNHPKDRKLFCTSSFRAPISFPLFSCNKYGRYHSHGRDIRRYFHWHIQLIGSDENHTLRFLNNNVQLSGSIDDGSGTNVFKYSNTTKTIFVNLGTGQATGVTSRTYTGVVANIHDILAGPGNDYLLAAR
jgi:hypothetical protein